MARLLPISTLLLLLAGQAWAAAEGKVDCKIMENGESGSGTLVLRAGGAEAYNGSCQEGVEVPAGSYEALLGLDGALDGPQQTRRVTVKAGKTAELQADFATGILEVQIRQAGRRAAGMAIIRKDGRQIGSLGSGVAAHLSTGTYEVVARYRANEKRFESVQIERGKRVVLEAAF